MVGSIKLIHLEESILYRVDYPSDAFGYTWNARHLASEKTCLVSCNAKGCSCGLFSSWMTLHLELYRHRHGLSAVLSTSCQSDDHAEKPAGTHLAKYTFIPLWSQPHEGVFLVACRYLSLRYREYILCTCINFIVWSFARTLPPKMHTRRKLLPAKWLSFAYNRKTLVSQHPLQDSWQSELQPYPGTRPSSLKSRFQLPEYPDVQPLQAVSFTRTGDTLAGSSLREQLHKDFSTYAICYRG